MPSGRTKISPKSGRGLGHVTPTIFGSTVGYPSDSLAFCFFLRRITPCLSQLDPVKIWLTSVNSFLSISWSVWSAITSCMLCYVMLVSFCYLFTVYFWLKLFFRYCSADFRKCIRFTFVCILRRFSTFFYRRTTWCVLLTKRWSFWIKSRQHAGRLRKALCPIWTYVDEFYELLYRSGLIEHGFTSAPTQYRLYGRRTVSVRLKVEIHEI